MRLRRAFLLIVSIGIGSVLLLLFSGQSPRPREREIQIHLRTLENAACALFPPANWRDALTWKRLRANFSKTSFHNNPGSVMEEERNKLVDLGYFQHRTLTLASSNLMREFSATSQVVIFTDMNWIYSTKEGTNISLTAFSEDLPKWEQIVSNLNSAVLNGLTR